MEAETAKEMVLIINVDTLRYDKIGVYGNNRNLTPYLDDLSKKLGIIFDQAYSSSNHTRPSVVSLFTGNYPTNHGFWHQKSSIKIKEPNIATVVPDDFITIFVNANPNTAFLFSDYFKYSWSEYPDNDLKYADSAYYPAEYIFNKAINILKKANFPQKVLLYIQPADPHGPYYPLKEYSDLFIGDIFKSRYSGKYRTELADLPWDQNLGKISNAQLINLKNRYDAEVRYLDEEMHYFWKFISRKYKKIFFIFTSDHGESFFDHNDAGHGTSLYNEQIKIPFIIIDTEKRLGNKRRVDELISNVDILPTIADTVNYKKEIKCDGMSIFKVLKYFKSLLPLEKTRTIASEVVHSSESIDIDNIDNKRIKKLFYLSDNKPINALIRANIIYEKNIFNKKIYKHIENKNPYETKILLSSQKVYFQAHYHELYRINSDKNEKKNIFNEHIEIINKILGSSPLRKKHPEFYGNNKKLSKEEIQRLKSLGYIK
jgi:arylsulfatase A-like enzyme